MKEFLNKIGAKKVSKDKIKDIKTTVHLTMARKPTQKDVEHHQQQVEAEGDQVTVIVDGFPVDIFRGTVELFVKIGFWIVVWPGTTIPVGHGETRNGYPPIWIGDDIPA